MKKLKTPILFFFSLILIGCSSNSNIKKTDLGSFTLNLPSDWVVIKENGIDSQMGNLTNGIDTITFDFGEFSTSFSEINPKDHLFSVRKVNGKLATIIKPAIKGKGIFGINFKNAKKGNDLSLQGINVDDEGLILSVFNSIKFDDEVTNQSEEIKQAEFSQKDYVPTANGIFKYYCQSCHDYSDANSIGPSLNEMTVKQFDFWFFDPKVNDPRNLGANHHRELFKPLPKEEIELIKFLIERQ